MDRRIVAAQLAGSLAQEGKWSERHVYTAPNGTQIQVEIKISSSAVRLDEEMIKAGVSFQSSGQSCPACGGTGRI